MPPSNQPSQPAPPTPPSSGHLRVPERSQPTPIIPEKNRFWDAARTRNEAKSAMGKRLLRAIRKYEQMEKYNLHYRYTEMDAKEEIRLGFIEPAIARDEPLTIMIKTYWDNDTGRHPKQEYKALPYHWGPGLRVCPVFLKDSDLKAPRSMMDIEILKAAVPDFRLGERIYVKPDLDKALRHLRHIKEIVIMWVDAICINEEDEEVEKPAQIAKMMNIYKNATNNCIWLGEGNDEFYSAMKFIPELLDVKHLDELCHDEKYTKQWSNLLDLMRCSWFPRR